MGPIASFIRPFVYDEWEEWGGESIRMISWWDGGDETSRVLARRTADRHKFVYTLRHDCAQYPPEIKFLVEGGRLQNWTPSIELSEYFELLRDRGSLRLPRLETLPEMSMNCNAARSLYCWFSDSVLYLSPPPTSAVASQICVKNTE